MVIKASKLIDSHLISKMKGKKTECLFGDAADAVMVMWKQMLVQVLKMSPHRHPCVTDLAESLTPASNDSQSTSTATSASTSASTSTATSASNSASTSTSEPQFVHTQKNNRALVVDNFLFYNDGKDLWRCAHRFKDKCKKTCRIVNGKVTTNTDIKHSHPPLDDHDIKMYEINHAVKEKAVERPDDKPFLVLIYVLHDINSEKLNMTEFAHLRRNACRAKHIVH